MTSVQKLKELGEGIGLTGADLAQFIKEQQTEERAERDKQRQFAQVEAAEKEKERAHQKEQMAEKEKQREYELKKIELEAHVRAQAQKEQQEFEEKKAKEQREYEMEREREAQARAIREKEEREQELTREREQREQELRKLEMEAKAEERRQELEIRKIEAEARARRAEARGSRQASDSENEDPTPRRTRVMGKVPKMPYFDEDKDFMDSYLNRFERFAQAQGWRTADLTLYLSALLKGRALDVYSRLPPDQAADYETLKSALLKRYQLTADGFKYRFHSAKPEQGEIPAQFITRLDSYLTRWMELAEAEKTYDGLKTLIVKEQYINICSKELATFLRERKPKDLRELGVLAEQYLEAHSSQSFTKAERRRFRSPTKRKPSEGDQRRCHRCGSPSHLVRDCQKPDNRGRTSFREPRESQTPRAPPSNLTCFNCGGRGHYARNCMKGPRTGAMETRSEEVDSSELGNTEVTAAVKSTTPQQAVCKAHKRVNCTECFDFPGTSYPHHCNACDLISNEVILPCGRRMPVIADACHQGRTLNMPVADGTLQGKPVRVLRDTGCSTVVVKQDLVPAEQLTGETEICVLIDGTVRKTPVAKVYIETPYLTGEVRAVCMTNPLYDLIIGNVPNVSETSTVEPQSAAVVTRSQAVVRPPKPLCVPPEIATDVSKEELMKLQSSDLTLETAMKAAEDNSTSRGLFVQHRGLLYKVRRDVNGQESKHLALPTRLRPQVIRLAHEGIMSGHQGIRRTLDRVAQQFWWKGMDGDVTRFCRSCDICQRTIAKGRISKVPLGKVPIIETPFKRVAVDIIGPICPATSRGNRFALTLVDYATRYPEAVALKNIETETVAEAMVSMFSRLGIPEEILSDQGSQFTSGLMREISRLLSMRQLTTTPYHPQCNGLVERFNGTLKTMLRRLCVERPKDWDRYIDPLLFAYREAPQESLGFSPFEMLYGRNLRGPMKILRELWTKEQSEPEVRTTYEYVVDLRNRLQDTWDLAHEQLAKAQKSQKKFYDLKSRERRFKVGERVLVLLPTSENKLLVQWKGPYPVLDVIGDSDYKIHLPTRDRIFHVNLLKKYHERSPPDEDDDTFDTTIHSTGAAILEPQEETGDEIQLETWNRLQNETIEDVKIHENLTEEQRTEVKGLVQEFRDIFTDVPNITNLGEHSIQLTTAEPIRGKAYPLPHAMRENLDKEIDAMLDLNVIESSTAAYASPVVMVKKPDGSIRVCVDYRKLNRVTIFDPEPMPNVEEIFAKLADSRYFSKFDLSKGYWQVPMKDEDKDLTTFICHRGLFRFRVMPFGLVNAPATFSRIMRRLLRESQGLHNYLDDVLAHDKTWKTHLDTLRDFFTRVRNAKLTLRPSKCEIGAPEVPFLGFQVREGEIHPQAGTVEKILQAPRPETKKQMRAFLGLAGFYRKFVPNFATVAAPLTDLVRKRATNELSWNEAQMKAFEELKRRVANPPILALADLSRVFILQTDASNTGIGAVLLQEDSEGIKRPISFASRKLLPRESRYSTIERECLAIVWAITKFQEYLYGVEFILETDHQPLQYLGHAQYQNGRLMRWALSLQPYRFVLRAIRGKDNVGADFLSRRPIE